MANKILADLAIRMSAQTAELKKGLENAKGRMKGVQKETGKLGKTMQGAFSKASAQLDNVIPGFSRLTSGIAGATKGVGGFTGSLKVMKMALMSTGIGAIVVALGSLISYFKNTKKGADIFNKALGGIKAVIDTVMHRVNLMGEAFTALMKGNFKEAADLARQAFSKMGEEIKANYKEGRALAERENKLQKDKIAFIEQEAKMRLEIARLIDISSDKLLDTATRRKATNEAIKLQNKLSDETVRIAEEEAAILKEKNALGDNTYEDDKAEAEARARILLLRKEEYDKVRELKNRNEEIQTTIDAEVKAAEKLKDTFAELAKFEPAPVEDISGIFEGLSKDAEKELEAFATVATEDSEETFQKFADNIAAQVENTKARIVELNAGLSAAVSDMIVGVADAIGRGDIQGVFATVANAIGGFAQKLGTMLIAQAIAIEAFKKSLQSLNPVVALVAGVALVAAGAAFKAFANRGIPEMAEGGLVYGDSLVRVGEYSGARANPEVIAPLDKLAGMIQGGGRRGEQLVARVTGDELHFVLQEFERKQANTF